MRALAIRGGAGGPPQTSGGATGIATVHGVQIACGFATSQRPVFDASSASALRVLVRVRGFSCNFRDRRRVLQMATIGPAAQFLVIGSEFVGEVVAVGAAVTRLVPGMRVMGDNHYPTDRLPTGRVGVPSNRSSSEYLVLRENQVCAVPATMTDAQAAAFSIGAQTAYSMVRKMDVRRGDAVLVTAARSNTSLFLIGALRAAGAHVVATTSSADHTAALVSHGAAVVVHMPNATDTAGLEALRTEAFRVGGFVAVADPFFDVHLCHVLPLMTPSGRYVTCGFHGQHAAVRADAELPDFACALQVAILKNISIIGNCAGVHADLTRAIADWSAGRLPVVLDTVLTTDQSDEPAQRAAIAARFIARSFDAPTRLGKVIALYT
jgi:NADPH:quinone reductase-like Zn-dependent oxidoreductase